MIKYICPMCFADYDYSDTLSAEEIPICECDTKVVPYKQYLQTADVAELKEVKKSLRLTKWLNNDNRDMYIKRVENLIEAIQSQ